MFSRSLIFAILCSILVPNNLIGMQTIQANLINQCQQTWILPKNTLVSACELSEKDLKKILNMLNAGILGTSFIVGALHSFHKSAIGYLIPLWVYAFVVNNEYKKEFVTLHGYNEMIDGKLIARVRSISIDNPFKEVNQNQLLMTGSVIGAYAAGFALQSYIKYYKNALLGTNETLVA